MVAPSIAPSSCATMYTGTADHSSLPMAASPIVTAGFRCAPLNVPTAYTASVTANAHPAVMTIQPLFCPFVLLSTTFATTPSPRMISSMVPSSSARNGDMALRGGGEGAAKLAAGRDLVQQRARERDFLFVHEMSHPRINPLRDRGTHALEHRCAFIDPRLRDVGVDVRAAKEHRRAAERAGIVPRR